MCGLAGILTLDADGRPEPTTLARMGAALAHRGPDASGAFADADGIPAAALIHRRLSIIDLSEAAHQPLANEDGTVHVALNGEIYTFQELRRELESRHVFRS